MKKSVSAHTIHINLILYNYVGLLVLSFLRVSLFGAIIIECNFKCNQTVCRLCDKFYVVLYNTRTYTNLKLRILRVFAEVVGLRTCTCTCMLQIRVCAAAEKTPCHRFKVFELMFFKYLPYWNIFSSDLLYINKICIFCCLLYFTMIWSGKNGYVLHESHIKLVRLHLCTTKHLLLANFKTHN